MPSNASGSHFKFGTTESNGALVGPSIAAPRPTSALLDKGHTCSSRSRRSPLCWWGKTPWRRCLTPHRICCPITSHLSPATHARSGRALVGNVPSYLRPITSARLVTSPAARLAVLFGGFPFSLLHHELSPSPLHQVIPLGILTCGNRSIFKRKERWRREETSWGGAIVSCSRCPTSQFLFPVNILRTAVHSNFLLLYLSLSKKAFGFLLKLAARSAWCLHSQIQGCSLAELGPPASST